MSLVKPYIVTMMIDPPRRANRNSHICTGEIVGYCQQCVIKRCFSIKHVPSVAYNDDFLRIEERFIRRRLGERLTLLANAVTKMQGSTKVATAESNLNTGD